MHIEVKPHICNKFISIFNLIKVFFILALISGLLYNNYFIVDSFRVSAGNTTFNRTMLLSIFACFVYVEISLFMLVRIFWVPFVYLERQKELYILRYFFFCKIVFWNKREKFYHIKTIFMENFLVLLGEKIFLFC